LLKKIEPDVDLAIEEGGLGGGEGEVAAAGKGLASGQVQAHAVGGRGNPALGAARGRIDRDGEIEQPADLTQGQKHAGARGKRAKAVAQGLTVGAGLQQQ
jgi:hypothetical protein